MRRSGCSQRRLSCGGVATRLIGTTRSVDFRVRIEPGVGGRLIEVYDLDTGAGCEAGRVSIWEPGHRLGLTWTQLGWPKCSPP
jgi:hypothetical protein